MRKQVSAHGTTVWLSADDTHAFARRWPCSTLSNRRVVASFDARGNLEELAINGGRGSQECDATEFDALIAHYLGDAHPEPETETAVLFRRWPKSAGGDAIALFPFVAGSNAPGDCNSFQHVGQHGTADLRGVVRATEPASVTEPDIAALKRELEAAPYGYRLRVLRRSPTWSAIKRERERAP